MSRSLADYYEEREILAKIKNDIKKSRRVLYWFAFFFIFFVGLCVAVSIFSAATIIIYYDLFVLCS